MAASTTPLPPDLAITDRSRKFHDGTYKWDAEGFTDEHGVYREFDCLDPLARAPTPMPPMFPDDDVNDEEEHTAADEVVQPVESHVAVTSSEPTSERAQSSSEPGDVVSGGYSPKTPRTIRRLAMAILDRPRKSTSPSQNVATTGSQNNITIIDALESMVIEPIPAELDSHTDAKMSERLSPKEISMMKMPDTPPQSPPRVAEEISPKSTLSTLSPVPSNLSEAGGDADIKIKGAAATLERNALERKPSVPDIASKAPTQPKTRGSTRGVAKKITKRTKKTAVSKSTPPKRKETSVEDFTLQELHSGTYMRTRGTRRSARNVRSEEN